MTRKAHNRVSQGEILETLRETNGGELQTIAEHFGVSLATAQRRLDGLVYKRLVDENGRRGARCYYTPTAQAGDMSTSDGLGADPEPTEEQRRGRGRVNL